MTNFNSEGIPQTETGKYYEDMDINELSNDPVAGPIVERKAREYLRHHGEELGIFLDEEEVPRSIDTKSRYPSCFEAIGTSDEIEKKAREIILKDTREELGTKTVDTMLGE